MFLFSKSNQLTRPSCGQITAASPSKFAATGRVINHEYNWIANYCSDSAHR